MKLMSIYNKVISSKLYELAAYRGGKNTPYNESHAIVKYFTPNVAYANWFEKYNDPYYQEHPEQRVKKSDLQRIETDDYRLLDMRELGLETNFNTFKEFITDNELLIPDDYHETPDNYWDGKLYTHVLLNPQKMRGGESLWKEIGKRYDGVIIKESHDRLRRLGAVDAYIILTDRLK